MHKAKKDIGDTKRYKINVTLNPTILHTPNEQKRVQPPRIIPHYSTVEVLKYPNNGHGDEAPSPFQSEKKKKLLGRGRPIKQKRSVRCR